LNNKLIALVCATEIMKIFVKQNTAYYTFKSTEMEMLEYKYFKAKYRQLSFHFLSIKAVWWRWLVHMIGIGREEGSNAGSVNRKKEGRVFFLLCAGSFLQSFSAEKFCRKKREKWANFLKDNPTESCHIPSAEFCWRFFDWERPEDEGRRRH